MRGKIGQSCCTLSVRFLLSNKLQELEALEKEMIWPLAEITKVCRHCSKSKERRR
jgi:hypothetical protein